MTIPEDFAQITHVFTGTQLPNGAAVVHGVANLLSKDAETIATDTHGFFTAILAQLSAGISLDSTICKLGPDATGPSFEFIDPTPGGVASASGLSPNSAYLCTKQTAVGGRRGKGRMFIPGCDESTVGPSGLLTPSFVTTLQGLVDGYLADLLTADTPMVLLHGPATEWVLVDGQPRRVPVAGPIPAPDVVTGMAVNGRVGTQRRRLR